MAGQDGVKVAFQGELGAFSEEAIYRFFGDAVEPLPRREFIEVGAAVRSGEADYGVLPIENTLAGSVVASYDVLAAGDLRVVGEVITPIRHCVLGIPGATLDGLERVLSHPVALAQCTRFLRARRGIQAVAVYDTAGAAREVAGLADPAVAAIAGGHAAARYGLEILAHGVEDRHDNQTRFLVVEAVRETAAAFPITRPASDDGAPVPMRTTLLVETGNTPGSLVHVLLPFADRGINLSKLESRPTGEPWSYRFFLEFDADLEGEDAREALDAVRRRALAVRTLGSYPRWTGG